MTQETETRSIVIFSYMQQLLVEECVTLYRTFLCTLPFPYLQSPSSRLLTVPYADLPDYN